MNASNAKDYLPLVQALAEGKLQEFSELGRWHDCSDTIFGKKPERYRIKPEPREFWLVDGFRAFNSEDTARSTNHSGRPIIHVREVL